jgi:hypothetical protein
MAWEELLRLHDTGKESQALVYDAEAQDKGGLIRQVSELVGTPPADESARTARDAAQDTVRCQDGYVRRSPVQPYGIAADYTRRRARRIVTAIVILVFAVLLVFALMRSGLLVFRLR